MTILKLLLPTATLIAVTSMAAAGGLADPIMEMAPVQIAEATPPGSSGANLIVPLILVALIAVAMNGSDPTPLFAPSDARVKTDITATGITANGLTIYQYCYTGSSQVFEGVIAQEVLMHTPEAVVSYPSGMLAVNYDCSTQRFALSTKN